MNARDRMPGREAPEPLWRLLYRYWFWSWLFLDAGCGDRLLRAAALAHNIRQRVHLAVYMRRWTFLLLALASIGDALDRAASPPALTASFFVCASLGVVVVTVAAAAWALLSSR